MCSCINDVIFLDINMLIYQYAYIFICLYIRIRQEDIFKYVSIKHIFILQHLMKDVDRNFWFRLFFYGISTFVYYFIPKLL